MNGLLEDPKVWNDNAKSQALGKEKRELGLIVESLNSLQIGLKDAQELFDMAREENDDDTLFSLATDSEAPEKQIVHSCIKATDFEKIVGKCKDAGLKVIEFPRT